MFTTIFGFTFLTPMMAQNKSSAATTIFSFLISCHKSLAPSLPVCFLYCFLKRFFDGQNSQPKRNAIYIFFKDVDGFRLTHNTMLPGNVPTFWEHPARNRRPEIWETANNVHIKLAYMKHVHKIFYPLLQAQIVFSLLWAFDCWNCLKGFRKAEWKADKKGLSYMCHTSFW